MQAKMREVFQAVGKELQFSKTTYGGPGRWIVLVDGKKLGERIDEWTFKYTPKKEASK
jgi:hypothetical protein